MKSGYLKATEPAKTVEDVIRHVDEVIEVSRSRRSRIGYFAALYRHVAVKFKASAEEGVFRHPELIDKLDVVFLNRYLEALRQFQEGQKPSRSWQVAFNATGDPKPTTMQHLMLGMNAHINFDLGIAAAEACSKDELPLLHEDFERMNAILASLLKGVEDDLARIWPALRFVNRLFGRMESLIVDFSMKEARELAWKLAVELAEAHEAERAKKMQNLDTEVGEIGRLIWKPPFPASIALRAIRLGERGTVSEIIDRLVKMAPAPMPVTVEGARV
jgi:hypothetical protein